MKENKQSTDFIKKALLGVLLLLSFVAAITKVLTGFDIDEAYALAMPYRVLQGDRLFLDMWEVHQTSVFLPYLFIRLFSMFSKDMTYLVLYTRCVTTVIHFGMSLLVFFGIKDLIKTKPDEERSHVYFVPALLALGYYNLFPKWMINLDFSMQQLWFFTLFLFFLFKAVMFSEKKKIKKRTVFLLVAGLMLAMDVLAYPGMVILYPVTVVLLLWIKNGADGEKGNRTEVYSVLWLTLGCAAAAVIFFAMILSYMSLGDFLAAIPKVFMDGAHQYDAGVKLSLYISQWAEVLVQTVILTAPALCTLAVTLLLYKRSRLGSAYRERYGRLPFGLLFCLIFETEVSALITFAGLFVTWGPFRLQVRYIIQFVMAGILLIYEYKKKPDHKPEHKSDTYPDSKNKTDSRRKREKRFELLCWTWWLSLAAFAGVLLASNVGPTTSASYLVIGNLLFVGITVPIARKYGKVMEGLAYIGAILFLTSLLMCKGFYMRNTEYVPGDITQGLSKIEEGPLAGIYVRGEDYQRLVPDYHTIREQTQESDRVLFMGTESLSNLYARGRIVSPTTISTPAFNEQWVEYFTLYPEKTPTVIFLAKNTVDNREKFFAKNPFGIWIAKYYDVECMEETESLCILRPKEKGESDELGR